MVDEHHPVNQGMTSESSAIILQIKRSSDKSPVQFPAVIRNLRTGVVTLEVNNPWTILNWESLKGQKGCLRLPSGNGEFIEMEGTITWTKCSVQSQNSGRLSLNLKLTHHDPVAQKQLSEFIDHTEDIKGLWDRWDQVQANRPSKGWTLPTKTGFIALTLLLSGLALQLTGAQGFKLFGWVLWFFGTLVVAVQGLRFWRSRKASN